MKRQRGGSVCVVKIGPIGNRGFGVPVGATNEAIAFVVATIEHEQLSNEEIIERYNRSIQIAKHETDADNAEAVAIGIRIGLGIKRVPNDQKTYYAFSSDLIDDAKQRLVNENEKKRSKNEEDTSDDSESSDDIPNRVENNSESVEEISSSDFSMSDGDILSSGETSEE